MVKKVRKTKVSRITRSQYFQLVGLRSLAEQNTKEMQRILKAAHEITTELSDCGQTLDCMYGSREVDEMLELLGLKIKEGGKWPTTKRKSL